MKFDIEHEVPVRGPDGFCIECADNEAGEAIGMIADEPGKTFDGYSKAGDSQKKILHGVFKTGDAWFRTGDLMRRDAHGYFYFVDRIGDTFRWKGENVSTGEVGEALAAVPGILEANVYGVTVPDAEGPFSLIWSILRLQERTGANYVRFQNVEGLLLRKRFRIPLERGFEALRRRGFLVCVHGEHLDLLSPLDRRFPIPILVVLHRSGPFESGMEELLAARTRLEKRAG